MKTLGLVVIILTISLAIIAAPGDLDDFFGTRGKFVTPIRASFDEANALAIQSDGKIVVAGLSWKDSCSWRNGN